MGVLGRFGLGATSMQIRQGNGSGGISVLVMAAKERGFLGTGAIEIVGPLALQRFLLV